METLQINSDAGINRFIDAELPSMGRRLMLVTALDAFLTLSFSQRGEAAEEYVEQPIELKVGDKIPNITLPDTARKPQKLHRLLQGKIVLVELWYSNCGPCREEHPALIEIFNKHQASEFVAVDGTKIASGFEIVSISTDTFREPWLRAIEADKLPWKGHLWDRNSEVAISRLGINKYPTTFLVSERGDIAAIDPKLSELDVYLTEITKK